ncbi:MAG: hypothetical protein Q9M20_07800 [Mariprofundaceae bacterium]|nr:hypothetical protein [Mariprofundaceae bacterium]
MESTSIVIIGLGKVGTFFLEQLIQRSNLGLHIACVVEPENTHGKIIAQNHAIACVGMADVIDFSEDVGFIFNCTGDRDIQVLLREELDKAENKQTEVVSDHVLKVIWSILSDEAMPS